MPESDKELETTIEQSVNDLLISNGWDYEDRKRVLFMLRNPKPRKRTEQAFFADAYAEVRARSERRRAGGV